METRVSGQQNRRFPTSTVPFTLFRSNRSRRQRKWGELQLDPIHRTFHQLRVSHKCHQTKNHLESQSLKTCCKLFLTQYEFIELAFETNMHSSIKDIFKSYRAITQGQYSESLKYVLEHYRDKKLETILEEEITTADLPIIRALPSIEIEEPSP